MFASKALMRGRTFATSVKKLGIVGAGQMGTGIGIVASRHADIEVKFVDPFEGSRTGSAKFISSWCDKEMKKERLTAEEKEAVIGRISHHESMKALNDVDFCIEAANEDFELKTKIFKDLAGITPKDCILATNTSSISITKIAGLIPERAH